MSADEAAVEAYRESSVCPECREGKHRNCDGSAWSNMVDGRVGCSCWGGQWGNHGTRKGMEQIEQALAELETERIAPTTDSLRAALVAERDRLRSTGDEPRDGQS